MIFNRAESQKDQMFQRLHLVETLDAIAGRTLHGLWLGLSLILAFVWMSQFGVNATSLGAWGLVALPGLLGLIMASKRLISQSMVRFSLVIAWTFPALMAAVAADGIISPAALMFLAGPVALTASARPRHALISWFVSLSTFALFAGYAYQFGAPTQLSGFDPLVYSLLSAFLFVGVATGILRLSIRLGRVRQRISELVPQAEGFANAPTALVVTNTSGDVLAASKTLRRLVPGAPRDMAGLPLKGFGFDELNESAITQGVHASLDGGGENGGEFEFAVRDRKGQPVCVNAHSRMVSSGLVIQIEQPEHSDLIEKLRAERDEALAASRSKSEFLAAISHEIRTPLNAIIGFSDVMKQRLFGPLPSRYAEYGELIHESGVHLLDLIGDVLDMSKIEADRYELDISEFDIVDIVKTSLKMMRMRAEDKSVMLSTDTRQNPVMVKADRKAVRQILLNLISNAIKFTPEGGAVAVVIREEGASVQLAVGDSGVGMSAEEVQSIGQAFNQTRSGRETDERGSGLGLSLVQSLASLHGGQMDVDSQPGEGTTVMVTLPVLIEPKGQVEELPTLPVHDQIKRAQKAGSDIAKIASAS